MSSISPVNGLNQSAPASGVRRNAPAPTGEAVKLTLAPVDSVDISAEARAAESSDQRVARVKAAIKDGTYLHPDKLDIALDRMIDALG